MQARQGRTMNEGPMPRCLTGPPPNWLVPSTVALLGLSSWALMQHERLRGPNPFRFDESCSPPARSIGHRCYYGVRFGSLRTGVSLCKGWLYCTFARLLQTGHPLRSVNRAPSA